MDKNPQDIPLIRRKLRTLSTPDDLAGARDRLAKIDAAADTLLELLRCLDPEGARRYPADVLPSTQRLT